MSNERWTPENPTEDDALGSALGDAIRGRVETPAARPPVSSIAERAAARAKARNTRRAVAGIAASTALVAGGITAWNALEDDQPTEVIVVDESPTTFEPAPTTAPIDSPADVPPGVSPDSTGTATPESLSTGPALEWEELDPASVFGADLLYVGSIESVGDGRVMVKTGNSDRTQVMVSANGTDWSAVPMPPSLTPESIDIAGDRWLVTGWSAIGIAEPAGPALFSDDQSTTTAPDAAPMPSHRNQALFSDDQGATWTDLGISLDPVEDSARVAAALVSGKNMVVAVNTRTHPDVASVIVARGLVPDKESIRGWTRVEGDTVSFTRDESSAPESFELTAEEEDFLYGGIREYARLYFSDGGPAQEVAEFSGIVSGGYSTDDGFHLALLGHKEELLLTSSGGRQWSQEPLGYGDGVPIEIYPSSYSYPDSTIWTASQTGGDYRIERAEGIYAPPLVAELPNGIGGVNSLAVGPGGIAVVAMPSASPDPLWASPELRLVENGYELRYNEPVGGFTLWDLAEDAPVYEFDFEALRGNTPPRGFRPAEDENGGSGHLIFEDLETGDDLVTFNMDDLEAALLESLPDSGDEPIASMVQPKQPDLWVGWSIDGSAWGWQTISDAFNLTESDADYANVELAVGTNFVLARVETYVAEPSGTASDGDGDSSIALTGRPARLFIATVQ